MPERIILGQADDLRDVIHRAVACLAQGGIIALATDSRSDLMTSALRSSAMGRIFGGVGSGNRDSQVARGDQATRRAPILLLRSSAELADWVTLSPASIAARKLPERVWPGDVIFRMPPKPGGLAERLSDEIRALLVTDDRLLVWSPAERIVREVLRLSSGPLVFLEGRNDPLKAEALLPAEASGPNDPLEAAMILDFGRLESQGRPTVVALEEEGWAIIRPGVVAEEVIERWAGIIILFVCTGNTCRSPMAEALCKAVLARRIGCPVADLTRHGYFVTSAGVAAGEGMSAASNAIEVVEARGGSLVGHQSQQVTPEIVRRADHVLAMTWDHLDALLDQVPEAGHRVRLLDPTGGDIPDPVGEDLATYRATAQEIERHLEHLLGDLGL